MQRLKITSYTGSERKSLIKADRLRNQARQQAILIKIDTNQNRRGQLQATPRVRLRHSSLALQMLTCNVRRKPLKVKERS